MLIKLAHSFVSKISLLIMFLSFFVSKPFVSQRRMHVMWVVTCFWEFFRLSLCIGHMELDLENKNKMF